MLKKTLMFSLLGLASTGAFAGNADFTLVNKTGYAINEVFISPTKQDNWGKDRLGENQFLNGDKRTFRFGDTKHCNQDIKVIFTEGQEEVEWENINLCEAEKITLKYNRKSGEVSAEIE